MEVGGDVSSEEKQQDVLVDEGTVDITDRRSEQDQADEDLPDGFLGHFLSGSYNPRGQELEHWGTGGPAAGGECSEDPDAEIYPLLLDTAPAARWRVGLKEMLRSCKSEPLTRTTLAFLHACIKSAVDTIEEDGLEATVNIDVSSAPIDVRGPDWMAVLGGLNLTVAPQSAEEDLDRIDANIGDAATLESLAGFCHLMQKMLELSWTNLHLLVQLEDSQGRQLYEAVAILCSGCGLDEASRAQMDDIEVKYPSIVRSLGFQRLGNCEQLQWEKPLGERTEFQSLFATLHCLFRSTEHLQTSL